MNDVIEDTIPPNYSEAVYEKDDEVDTELDLNDLCKGLLWRSNVD